MSISRPSCPICSQYNDAPFNGTLKTELVPPPVFPMVVRSNITTTSATALADIQFRPQDVGSSGSVFVFALAPVDIVKAAPDGTAPFVVGKTVSTVGAKADPGVACVLAQLDSSGQLQRVRRGPPVLRERRALRAGRLRHDPERRPHGHRRRGHLLRGLRRQRHRHDQQRDQPQRGHRARHARLRPQLPQTGWWWNPQEPGRGFSIEAQGNNLFMATYLYDISGRSTWHVAVGPTSLDGSLFTNQLLSFGGGVTLDGAYRGNERLPDAGPITLTFDTAARHPGVAGGNGIDPALRVRRQRHGDNLRSATSR